MVFYVCAREHKKRKKKTCWLTWICEKNYFKIFSLNILSYSRDFLVILFNFFHVSFPKTLFAKNFPSLLLLFSLRPNPLEREKFFQLKFFFLSPLNPLSLHFLTLEFSALGCWVIVDLKLIDFWTLLTWTFSNNRKRTDFAFAIAMKTFSFLFLWKKFFSFLAAFA